MKHLGSYLQEKVKRQKSVVKNAKRKKNERVYLIVITCLERGGREKWHKRWKEHMAIPSKIFSQRIKANRRGY